MAEKAKIIKPQELRNRDRIKLWEAVPLETPFLVYFDPSNLCNLRCKFCPTGYTEFRGMRPNKIMDWNLFTSIVDQFKEFPQKIRHVTMCKDGEPLVNKRFPEMVRYLRDADVAEKIITKSNGLMLNSELNTRIADCGLDNFGVSVKHVDPKKYEQITDVLPDYPRLVSNVADLYSKRGDMEIYVSLLDVGLSQEEKDKFFADFQHISDYIAIEDLHGWSMSDAADFTLGQTPKVTPIQRKVVCPLVMCSLVVNASGTVSLCGEDWAEKTIVGDLNYQTVREVWEGKAMREFRIMHLEGRRGENEACGNCNYLETLPDNLDDHREEMLGKL